jgi:hypothetical protein
MKIDTLARVLSVLRAVTEDSVIDSIGGRSRSAMLGPLGCFGVGLAVGTGVGMLFAPVTGDKARARARALLGDLWNKLESAQHALEPELPKAKHHNGDARRARA